LSEFVDYQVYSNKMLDVQNKSIKIENYYFNETVCSEVIFEYLFLLINEENESLNKNDDSEDSPRISKSFNSRRKSVFLPLLLEQQLVKSNEEEKFTLLNLENDEPSMNLFRTFNGILLGLDEKSVLLAKYLSGILSKYAKFVPINICTKNKVLQSRISDDYVNETSHDSCKYFYLN